MIIAEYKNKRITYDDLSNLLIENELSDNFLEVLVINLIPLKIFLKECLINDYKLKSVELLKSEFSDKKIKLGLLFENITAEELLNKYDYLQNINSIIYFMESYHYSKNIKEENLSKTTINESKYLL